MVGARVQDKLEWGVGRGIFGRELPGANEGLGGNGVSCGEIWQGPRFSTHVTPFCHNMDCVLSTLFSLCMGC